MPRARVRARRGRLPNGLRLVAVEMPNVHSVSLVAYVRAGSRYEEADRSGVGHFLEHMFFRGTGRYPSTHALAHRIESLGATFNATTTRDMAYYYTEVAPRHLEAGVEVLGQMFRHPLFPDVEIERKVILEEMSEDYNEDGVLIDPDSIAKGRLWPRHPLGMPIIGRRRVVQRMRRDDLIAHHRRLYRARNMILTAAGNVDLGELLVHARRHLGALPSGNGAAATRPPRFGRGGLHVVDNPDSQLAVDLVFPAFPEGTEDWKAAVLLRRILDDGISSRLHRAVVDRGGLAYGCEAILDGFHDTGTFEFECSLAPEKLPKLVDTLVAILSDLARTGPEPDELAKVKERYACDLEFSQDSVGEMAGWHGGVELYRAWEPFETALDRVRRVSVDDVRRIARRLFAPDRAHLVVVGEPSRKDLARAANALDRLT